METLAKSKDDRAELNKALYMAARANLPAWSRDDAEAVKAFRDHLTYETYGKMYSEMTKGELTAMIAYLNANCPEEKPLPTANELSTLKFYAMAVALVYANMKDWEYIDKSTGVVLSGEDLRNVLKSQYYNGEKKLPSPIVRRLYDEWINPKSNQFLMEGEHKKIVRNPNVLYYEKLGKREVKYLINRYSAVYNQAINKTARPVKASLN